MINNQKNEEISVFNTLILGRTKIYDVFRIAKIIDRFVDAKIIQIIILSAVRKKSDLMRLRQA